MSSIWLPGRVARCVRLSLSFGLSNVKSIGVAVFSVCSMLLGLVLESFIVEGYADAAAAFSQECGLQGASVYLNSVDRNVRVQSARTGTSYRHYPQPYALAVPLHLDAIRTRMNVRNAVLQRQIPRAIGDIRALQTVTSGSAGNGANMDSAPRMFPQLPPALEFVLWQQHVVDLLLAAEPQQALDIASGKLTKLATSADCMDALEDTMMLFLDLNVYDETSLNHQNVNAGDVDRPAYPPAAGVATRQFLLSDQHREQLAATVNAVLLSAELGHGADGSGDRSSTMASSSRLTYMVEALRYHQSQHAHQGLLPATSGNVTPAQGTGLPPSVPLHRLATGGMLL